MGCQFDAGKTITTKIVIMTKYMQCAVFFECLNLIGQYSTWIISFSNYCSNFSMFFDLLQIYVNLEIS